jgi:hypothetical protein
VLAFALDEDYVRRSHLADLVKFEPDLAPVGHVRRLLSHDDPRVHGAAAARLVEAHMPEDATSVLAHVASGRPLTHVHECRKWLGSHPDSEALLRFETTTADAVALANRRRAAGLPISPQLAELIAPAPAPATPLTFYKLDDADQLFIQGKLDSFIGTGAFDYYANVLRCEPGCAVAAFQIAWIDRGYGSLMTDQRIAYLRSLGVAEDLLADLARRPKRIMPGNGPGSDSRSLNPRRAQWALEAELPSIAALYVPESDWKATRALAEQHVARVRHSAKAR